MHHGEAGEPVLELAAVRDSRHRQARPHVLEEVGVPDLTSGFQAGGAQSDQPKTQKAMVEYFSTLGPRRRSSDTISLYYTILPRRIDPLPSPPHLPLLPMQGKSIIIPSPIGGRRGDAIINAHPPSRGGEGGLIIPA